MAIGKPAISRPECLAKVRAARIKVPGAGPDYCGVNTIEARKTLLATYTQEVQQAAISKSNKFGNG